MSSLAKTLAPIVKKRMNSLQGTAHFYELVERVFKIDTLIAEKEKADLELVQLGTLEIIVEQAKDIVSEKLRLQKLE